MLQRRIMMKKYMRDQFEYLGYKIPVSERSLKAELLDR